MSKKKSPCEKFFKLNQEQIPTNEYGQESSIKKSEQRNLKKVSITTSLPNLGLKNKIVPQQSFVKSKQINQQVSLKKIKDQSLNSKRQIRQSSISQEKASQASQKRKSSKNKRNEDSQFKNRKSSTSQCRRKNSKSLDKKSNKSRSRSRSGGPSVPRNQSSISQEINQLSYKKMQQKLNKKDEERQRQRALREQISLKEKQLLKISQKAQKLRDSLAQNENQSLNIRVKTRNDLQNKKMTKYLQDQLCEKEFKINQKINSIRTNSKDPVIGGGLRSQNFTRIVDDMKQQEYQFSSLERSSPLRNTSGSNPRQTNTSVGYDKIESILKNNKKSFLRTIDSNQQNQSPTIYDEVPVRGVNMIRAQQCQPLRQNHSLMVINNNIENSYNLENKIRERIDVLQNDIYQMERRLELVTEEVMRTQSEQEILLRRLTESHRYDSRSINLACPARDIYAEQSQQLEEIRHQRGSAKHRADRYADFKNSERKKGFQDIIISQEP